MKFDNSFRTEISEEGQSQIATFFESPHARLCGPGASGHLSSARPSHRDPTDVSSPGSRFSSCACGPGAPSTRAWESRSPTPSPDRSRDDLLAGRVESVAVIAKREGVLPNCVRRLTRLAFLAPKIVEAIAAGHQPPELTAKALTERIELPLLWNEQERSVGIN